jgi:hypothetical protein
MRSRHHASQDLVSQIAGTFRLLIVLVLPACSTLIGPTPVEDPMRVVAVEWENFTDRAYRLTFTQVGEDPAWFPVDPCTAGGTTMRIEDPFTIGLADADAQRTDAGRQVTDWRALHEASPGYVVVVIDANGDVTVEARSEQRSANDICT